MKYQPFDWYETPLYYDIIFDADTATEATFLEQVCDLHVLSRGRRVLEPACGSGRLLAAMSERGFSVTGFDINDGALAFARRRLRERGVRATIVNARMEDFSFNARFDLAHCLVSSFKYLLTAAAARSHLQCVADHLKPGGVYVLGIHLSDYADQKRSRERWLATRGGVNVTCNIQSWPPDRKTRLERVRSRLIVHERGEEKRHETNWQFRTYNLRQLRALLRTVPDLEHIATYDFHHDITHPVDLTDDQLDVVLILQRKWPKKVTKSAQRE